jgi:hypothetical protein
MKSNVAKIVALAVVVIGGAAGYFYWQQGQQQPAPVVAPPPVRAQQPAAPQAPKPEVRPVAQQAPAQPPLPKVAESDDFMLEILSGLVNDKSLMNLFHTERIVHNMVATIDNLPHSKAPRSVMPLRGPGGKFTVAGADGAWTISPNNAARYTPYVKLAQAVDTKQLVQVYIRIYPLFQQAYEQLGYPGKYFNDRLMETLDDLLDAPEVKGPVKLVRPNVMYLYADPELEAASAGQKILIRMGSTNAAKIKAKLTEIKQELAAHMHNDKLDAR